MQPFLVRDRRILRSRRERLVGFQGFVCEFNGLFQLRVVALDHEVGPLRYDVVGIHAMLLDDPLAAIIHAPEAKPGAVTKPPSRSGCALPIPTRPPQVRVPTMGPIFSRRKNHGKASPPEPASSFTIITFGPKMPAGGQGTSLVSRGAMKASSWRLSFSV